MQRLLLALSALPRHAEDLCRWLRGDQCLSELRQPPLQG
ncbi:hypothetical protein SynA1524_00820 [Synechococcus sp. A15-24]|nr:hypothetical protein SynA1524_00820 [Synechococcus sp. A15-24]